MNLDYRWTCSAWLIRTLNQVISAFHRFDYELAVCAVVKNEARYLVEWVDFHRLMGVEHFTIYDDGSTDSGFELLKPWIESGNLETREVGGRSQKAVYNEALRGYRRRAKWVAFLDLDEFLFSPNSETLPRALARYTGAPAVFVHWRLFGSGGNEESPSGPVLENYLLRQSDRAAANDSFDHQGGGSRADYVTGWSRDGKSVVQPMWVKHFGIHLARKFRLGRQVNEDFKPAERRTPSGTEAPVSNLRINHYWSKSRADLGAKIRRGALSQPDRIPNSLSRSLSREEMLNDHRDRLILEVRDNLSRRMAQP